MNNNVHFLIDTKSLSKCKTNTSKDTYLLIDAGDPYPVNPEELRWLCGMISDSLLSQTEQQNH